MHSTSVAKCFDPISNEQLINVSVATDTIDDETRSWESVFPRCLEGHRSRMDDSAAELLLSHFAQRVLFVKNRTSREISFFINKFT